MAENKFSSFGASHSITTVHGESTSHGITHSVGHTVSKSWGGSQSSSCSHSGDCTASCRPYSRRETEEPGGYTGTEPSSHGTTEPHTMGRFIGPTADGKSWLLWHLFLACSCDCPRCNKSRHSQTDEQVDPFVLPVTTPNIRKDLLSLIDAKISQLADACAVAGISADEVPFVHARLAEQLRKRLT